jgi:hypothetical protein
MYIFIHFNLTQLCPTCLPTDDACPTSEKAEQKTLDHGPKSQSR